MNLPTPGQMLANADEDLKRAVRALDDARDELHSDWPPGMRMTAEQADHRTRMFTAISEAKATIEAARRGAL